MIPQYLPPVARHFPSSITPPPIDGDFLFETPLQEIPREFGTFMMRHQGNSLSVATLLQSFAHNQEKEAGQKRKILNILATQLGFTNAMQQLCEFDTPAFTSLLFLILNKQRQKLTIHGIDPQLAFQIAQSITEDAGSEQKKEHLLNTLFSHFQDPKPLLQQWVQSFPIQNLMRVMRYVKDVDQFVTTYLESPQCDIRAFITSSVYPRFPTPLCCLMKTRWTAKIIVGEFEHFSPQEQLAILWAADYSLMSAIRRRQRFTVDQYAQQLNALFEREKTLNAREDFINSYLTYVDNEEDLPYFLQELTSPIPYLIPSVFFEVEDENLRTQVLHKAFPESKRDILQLRTLYQKHKMQMELILEMPLCFDGEVGTFFYLLKDIQKLAENDKSKMSIDAICKKIPPLLFFFGIHSEKFKPLILSLLPNFTDEQLKACAIAFEGEDIEQIFPHPFLQLGEEKAKILINHFKLRLKKFTLAKLHNWLQKEISVCKKELKKVDDLASGMRVRSHFFFCNNQQAFLSKRLKSLSVDSYIQQLDRVILPELREKDEGDDDDFFAFFGKITPDDLPALGLNSFEELRDRGFATAEDFIALGLKPQDKKEVVFLALKQNLEQKSRKRKEILEPKDGTKAKYR